MNIPQGSVLIPGSQIRNFCKVLYSFKSLEEINEIYTILEELDKDLRDKVEMLISNYDNNKP